MEKEITVYSTPTCPYCIAVKKYLRDKDIIFKEYDVSTDADARNAMVEKSGQLGVPVVDINGEIIVGFNKPLLDEIL